MWHPSPTLWTGTTGPRTITANHDLLYPNQWWKWFKVTGPYPLSLFLHWNGECLSHGALNTATILSHALLRPFYTSSNTRSSQGHAFFTFKASLAAISACHVGWNGAQYVQDSFTHPLATDFMKGTKHLQPPHSVLTPPPWKLALVQTALSSKPFKLLPDIDLKLLPLKTALLLALVSVKRVGDLTVLLVNPVYVQYPVPPQ